MSRLDPEDLRRFAQRDWGAPERLARQERATQPVATKIRIGVELYEFTKAARPDSPDEATRKRDLEHHFRLSGLLRRAVDVGAR